MPNNNEQQYQPLTFDAIKIGIASPDKIREWNGQEVRLQSRRRSTTEH